MYYISCSPLKQHFSLIAMFAEVPDYAELRNNMKTRLQRGDMISTQGTISDVQEIEVSMFIKLHASLFRSCLNI